MDVSPIAGVLLFLVGQTNATVIWVEGPMCTYLSSETHQNPCDDFWEDLRGKKKLQKSPRALKLPIHQFAPLANRPSQKIGHFIISSSNHPRLSRGANVWQRSPSMAPWTAPIHPQHPHTLRTSMRRTCPDTDFRGARQLPQVLPNGIWISHSEKLG